MKSLTAFASAALLALALSLPAATPASAYTCQWIGHLWVCN